jgi:hypothetical protein
MSKVQAYIVSRKGEYVATEVVIMILVHSPVGGKVS